MTLIFVRHGESTGNREGVAQGWRDYPLSELGRRQAEAVARRLADCGAVAVYSSDLRRAAETGAAVAAALGLAATPRAALREQRFGEREGLTWAQATARWGDTLRVGQGSVHGEEQTEAFRARVAAEFEALTAQHREDVAICATHGGVILMVVAQLLGLPPGRYPSLHLANASLTVVEQGRRGPVLGALNDVRHLDGITTGQRQVAFGGG